MTRGPQTSAFRGFREENFRGIKLMELIISKALIPITYNLNPILSNMSLNIISAIVFGTDLDLIETFRIN